MATLVFVGGLELVVSAELREILEHVDAAPRGGGARVPVGWITLTSEEADEVAGEVAVQTSQIAYLRP